MAFAGYLVAGPAGVAFGAVSGVGRGGIAMLLYKELKEKANRNDARGKLLAAVIALPGYSGPAGEKPSN